MAKESMKAREVKRQAVVDKYDEKIKDFNRKNLINFVTIPITTFVKTQTGFYKPGKSVYKGKGMVPHVQLSTNFGFGCFRNKKNSFH